MAASGAGHHLTALFDRLGDVVDPATLLACLNLAAEHYLTVDPDTAFRLADALVACGEWAQAPEQRALGLLGRGDALRRLGRPREAAQDLDAAGQAFLALPEPDEVGWARTRIGWIVAKHALGEWQELPATIDAAMAVFTARGEPLRAVKLATNAGVVHFERAEYPPAIARFDQALALCSTLDPARDDVGALGARIRSNRALVSAEMGQLDTALAELASAREVFAASGHADSALAQALNIAYVQRAMGEYAAALRQLDRVASAAEQQAATARQASARHEKAQILLALGDARSALWEAERACALYADLEHRSDATSEALILCAEIHATLGDAFEAAELLEVAEGLAAQDDPIGPSNDATRIAAAIALARGEQSLSAGGWAAAEREASRAHAAFEALGRGHDAARAALLRARALMAAEQPLAATTQATAALTAAELGGAAPLVPGCHHVLAVAALAQGRSEQAAEHFALAIDAHDRLAGRLTPNLRTFLQAGQRIVLDAIDMRLAAGHAPAAYRLLERSKAQALLAYRALGRPADGAPALGHGASSDGAASRHRYLVAQLEHLVRQPTTPASAAKIARLRHAVRGLEARLNDRRLRHTPGRARTAQDGWRDAAAIDPDALRAALPGDAVVIAFCFSDQRGGAFVLARDHALSWHDLGITRRQVGDLADAWGDAVLEALRARSGSPPDARPAAAGEEALRAIARRGYDALLAPLRDRLEGRRHVVLVPHGPSHALPFAALHDGRQHMIEAFDVSTCLSGRLLQHSLAQRPVAAGARIVVGDDRGGQLPGCRREALAIAERLGCRALVDGEATVRAMTAASAGPCGVLHVAAHGEARLDSPFFSFVALADGQLAAMDATRMALDGALVVLSACETGRSAVVGSDEAVGLGWAFLAAGASAVVQSQWRIDDEAAEQTMARLYDGLLGGQTVAAALGAAQRAGLAAPGARMVDWAAFQVVGDGTRTLPGGLASASARRAANLAHGASPEEA